MWPGMKKEMLEGVRTYKFLIIAAIFLFFALLNPIMNKMVLPEVLNAQFEGLDEATLSQMVISSQADCLRAYFGDVFEIVTLVIVFTLSSIVAGELNNKTLIIPRCSRKGFAALAAAKFMVYGAFIMLVSIICALIDYAYAGMLFGTDLSSVRTAICGGLLQGLYYLYVLGWVMLLGSLLKRQISTGAAALIPAYGTPAIAQLLRIDRVAPSGLLTEANRLADTQSADIIIPVIITVILMIVLVVLTVLRLRTLELSKE